MTSNNAATNQPIINMGDLCKDEVTGFQGIVTSQHTKDGITHYGVQPQTLKANGNLMKANLLEASRLTVVTPNAVQMRRTGTTGL